MTAPHSTQPLSQQMSDRIIILHTVVRREVQRRIVSDTCLLVASTGKGSLPSTTTTTTSFIMQGRSGAPDFVRDPQINEENQYNKAFRKAEKLHLKSQQFEHASYVRKGANAEYSTP